MKLRIASLLSVAAIAWSQEPAPTAEQGKPIVEELSRAPIPASVKDHIRRALVARDYATAEKLLVQEISADPKSADLLTFAAKVFLLDKNPANAAIALKKAEKLRPLAESERFELVMAYLGLKRSSWARPELDRLARDAPKNPLYQYWLARMDYDERNYAAAVARLRAVTSEDASFLRAWDNLGLSLEAMGLLEEAVASYREAARLNRDQQACSPWPPLNLGSLLTKTEHLKEAEAALREAVRCDGDLGEARYRLGVNLHKQGRDADAIVELRAAARLDSTATEPLYALGQIYRSQGNAKAAEEVLDRFRELKAKKRGS